MDPYMKVHDVYVSDAFIDNRFKGRGRGRGRRGRRGGRGGKTQWGVRSGRGGGRAGGRGSGYRSESGRGRGGLPNETSENLRMSGYGYIGNTESFPHRRYQNHALTETLTETLTERELEIGPIAIASIAIPSITERGTERVQHRTPQSKYIRKKRDSSDDDDDDDENAKNTISIKRDGGSIKQYVSFACNLLRGGNKYDIVIIKASGRAIGKAVNCVEVIKRKMYGLHQVTSLETIELTDYWLPLEIGLNEVVTKTYTTGIVVKLTYNDELINKDSPGYQQPISWIDLGDAREYLINKLRRDNKFQIDKFRLEISEQQQTIRDMKGKYDDMEETMSNMKGKCDDMEEDKDKQRKKYQLLQDSYNDIMLKHKTLKDKKDEKKPKNKYSAKQNLANNAKNKENEEKYNYNQENEENEENIKNAENAENTENVYHEWLKWNMFDVTNFIISIDQQRYRKYKQNLLKQLSDEGIDGSCLHQLTKNDLYRLGIRNFKDKRDIFEAIQTFTNQQN